ncbi:thiol:disulfide interchange protein DsbC [Sphingobium sp. B2D3A]|uniref:DsbC family protein n=1 Tax=unclassified Sphingobium TaxID=2611147 RepID=UPI002225529B|nr:MULTISPECIES: DsbC family protein [unclassified Sphingobium]MCW2339180.1 thiol:disulfide interchange protein DsbC [Sphingobium sp. B2D3A]MCW2386876.1 thiol:disulfide interchange protein DsbC [Sphingobium sp. B2D3D]
MKIWQKSLIVGGLVGGLLGGGAVLAAGSSNEAVAARLKARLPNTQISSVECGKLSGLCEVVAGKTLFYTDSSARYLVVGRVYDMEARQDLTAARLLEINPETLLGGAARSEQQSEDFAGASASPVPAAAAPRPAKLDVSKLGQAGAIVWGKANAPTVTIFTDFRCGYCRQLVATLEQMSVRVIERPISILGSRDLANRVYCSKDKARAVRAAYAGEALPEGRCDTSGLDANEAFAREHRLSGTPVIVRADGAMLEGFRPREVLERWIAGGAS